MDVYRGYDIKHRNTHYEAYFNGKFVVSEDTVDLLLKEIDEIELEKEKLSND